MTTGLVLGKFYPLHLGHIGLIEFAQKQCDELIVLVCASNREGIAGSVRYEWLLKTFENNKRIRPVLLNYDEDELPNTSVSSREVSKVWASKIRGIFNKIDIVFSSEPYGEFLAEYLNGRHMMFEPGRVTYNISASEIRQNVFQHWNYIAEAARGFFVKRICIYGTESTGKSTLTERLAVHFKTTFVPEMAREVIEVTDECTEMHLIKIAELHAKTINERVDTADKLLFVDTDLNITRSYSRYLFGKELLVDDWVVAANKFDLYLYLDADAPYIQDGTRLDRERRDELNAYHRKELEERGIRFEVVKGNWEERFQSAVAIVEHLLTENSGALK